MRLFIRMKEEESYPGKSLLLVLKFCQKTGGLAYCIDSKNEQLDCVEYNSVSSSVSNCSSLPRKTHLKLSNLKISIS